MVLGFGDLFNEEVMDFFLKMFFVMGFFEDVFLGCLGWDFVILVKENLIINWVVFENNKFLDDGEFVEEIEFKLCLIFICVKV